MRIISRLVAIILVLGLLIGFMGFSPVMAADVTSLRPDEGPVGTSVRVGGTGEPGENITIEFDGEEIENNIVASSSGSWSATIEIPERPFGDYDIVATGSDSGEGDSQTFAVLPQITLNKTKGAPGDKIRVTGTGFWEDEGEITITFGGVVVAEDIEADEFGSWVESFTVPSGSGGDYEVIAYGESTDDSDIEVVNFKLEQTSGISINRTSGAGGSPVIITGSGFGANETGIRVTFGGVQIGPAVTASSTGVWSISTTVPQSPAGTYTIDAYGNTTKNTTINDLSFTITPVISLNRTSAPPGATVSVTGSGFGAGESNIIVTYDGTPLGSPVSADDRGFWTTNITVPASTAGTHSIDAYGSSTSAASVSNVNFTVGAGISASQESGAAGTSITISGSGFAANEANIQVLFDGKPLGQPVKADAYGNWTSTVVIPPVAGGVHAIDANGPTTRAAAIADISFTSTAGISLSEASGLAGAALTLTGSGFAANETGITITFDGKSVGTPVTADPTGKWTATVTLPAAAGGSHIIDASGATTTAAAVTDASFIVKAGVTINKTRGAAGSQVLISGSGFAANSPLRVLYDDNPLNIGSITTDSAGSFSKNITIPKSATGPHSIKVTDAQNNAYVLDFEETTPPPVPNPLSPGDGDRTGEDPTFRWSAVSESNDVTYVFQIDTDPDFIHPLVQKSSLTGTRYTLTKAEALPAGQYYWRVKSVDPSGNESPWCAPMLLNAGGMPAGIIALIVILAVLAVLAALYYLWGRHWLRKRRGQIAAQAPAGTFTPAPEIVIPDVVNAEYRALDTDEATKKRALPWRLALPQAPPVEKGPRQLSPEDQARLKMIIEFAKSLPLAEPGFNTSWLIDIAESNTGSAASTALYKQVLKGEVDLHYDPAWRKHPTYMDLQSLLEGQPILQNLNSYIDTVDQISNQASHLLQEIYRDAVENATEELLADNGWEFTSSIYADAMSWFQCKYMREPTERDYSTKPEEKGDNEAVKYALYGEENTPFSGPIVETPGEKEAAELRALHLKLRRKYRNSEIARDVVSIIANLEVQRNRLQEDFGQFNRLNL